MSTKAEGLSNNSHCAVRPWQIDTHWSDTHILVSFKAKDKFRVRLVKRTLIGLEKLSTMYSRVVQTDTVAYGDKYGVTFRRNERKCEWLLTEASISNSEWCYSLMVFLVLLLSLSRRIVSSKQDSVPDEQGNINLSCQDVPWISTLLWCILKC